MKKILAAILAVLMVVPMLVSIASAQLVVPEGTETKNVASEAKIEVVDTNNQNISIGSNVNANWLIDGDKTTGTNSPQGQYYSYVLNYDIVRYFTEIVVACNGSGTLANGGTVANDTYNVKKIIIKVYYGSEVTYQSDILDVSKLKEVSVKPEVKGDKVEIYKVLGTNTRMEYMWEIETYAPDMELCSAQVENVASQAVFSATGGNANYWWAMDYKSWVDGDPLTGSHSPKGRNYSVWMHFSQEYLFSQIDLVCNTDGGATLTGTGDKINDRYIGNSMLRVLVYNYNEDLVWDSDLVDTSTTTLLSVSPYVEGAIIEIRFFNGNFGGGEYMYEVSAYAQSGEHVFERTDEENPSCYVPGFQELTCHCGKVIKQSIDATGFHKWNDGEVTKAASDTENGVKTYTCKTCGLSKNYDIAAEGHNWNSGKVYAPKCEEEGYTEYKCTDAGCTASYKTDYKDALAHNWDSGKKTKFPTVEEEGVITYTCSICNGEKYGRIRKHKYTDNVAEFTKASIKKYEIHINTESSQYNAATYVGVKPETMFDGDIYGTSWYGAPGSYVDVILDKTYVFTSGLFYASANWSQMEIEFFLDNTSTCKFNTGNVNTGTDTSKPQECDMYDSLKAGVWANKIRITTISPKWENGNACRLQELKLVAHSCALSAEDYIKDSNYVAAKCDTNGSCNAKCQVCNTVSKVTIPASADSHKFTSVVEDVNPTCLNTGVGHAQCTECKQTVNGITIPATGAHSYTKDVEIISAKCGFAGVGHKVCEYCDAVGSIYELEPTGVHNREWSLQSLAAYTAVGKTVYACKFCGDDSELDPATGKNVEVAEKYAIPDDIIEFVSASKSSDASGNKLSFTYKINLSYLPELEQTCDVRVITTIKDANGRVGTIESYGKYATNEYNAETGEFTVTIYPKVDTDKFEVTTCIRLMNFRGIVYKYFANGSYGSSISMKDVK